MEQMIKDTFDKAEIFWVALGSIITAFSFVYVMFFRGYLSEKKNLKNIKKSLEFEIISNIDMLFCGEVERQSLFDVIFLVRTKFVLQITNQEIFYKIQKLYNELNYYKIFVSNVYLKPYVSDGGFHTTLKQLQTCNVFLEYFGENPVEYDSSYREDWNQKNPGREYADFIRDKAIKIKKRKIEWWKRKIKNDVQSMFK